MVWATMTSKGQITVPRAVRESLRLTAGSTVDFTSVDGEWVLRRATTSIRSLRGCVPVRPEPVSLDEMDDAVASGAAASMNR